MFKIAVIFVASIMMTLSTCSKVNANEEGHTESTSLKSKIVRKVKQPFRGIASFYADKFQGRRTASGTVYDSNKLTCAHRTLPFGTKILVTNLQNGSQVEVQVTDRGPFHPKRIIDLSKVAARKLGITGLAKVICRVKGSDEDELASSKPTEVSY